MKRDTITTDSERLASTLKDIYWAEKTLLNSIRQQKGTSDQLRVAFEDHIKEQEFQVSNPSLITEFGCRSNQLPDTQHPLASYGLLGSFAGAALFNEAQCLLVKIEKNKNDEDL